MNYLQAYIKAINHIDDYFEYANESKTDRDKVQSILEQLTIDLANISSNTKRKLQE